MATLGPQPQGVGRRAGALRPYLVGPVRAAFDTWLEETVARHSPPLEFREIRKGVQALSSLYVERRQGADLAARAIEGRGKRAALATYYAPLHFLATWHGLEDVGAARLGSLQRVWDLGSGTGAAGAATGRAVAEAPEVTAVDRSGFVLSEARATYRAFGLLGRTRRGRLPGALPETGPGELLLFGWTLNELPEAERDAVFDAIRARLGAGVRLLVLEPLARPVSPWWRSWARELGEEGIEERQLKQRIALPEWIARLDRAAALDHRVLGARMLVGPLDAPEPELDPGEETESGAS